MYNGEIPLWLLIPNTLFPNQLIDNECRFHAVIFLDSRGSWYCCWASTVLIYVWICVNVCNFLNKWQIKQTIRLAISHFWIPPVEVRLSVFIAHLQWKFDKVTSREFEEIKNKITRVWLLKYIWIYYIFDLSHWSKWVKTHFLIRRKQTVYI